MDTEGSVQLAHVVAVEVAVLVCHNKVEGFHGVPAKRVGASLHDHLAQGRAVAQVVQRDAAVAARCRKHLWVRLHRGSSRDAAALRAGSCLLRSTAQLCPRSSEAAWDCGEGGAELGHEL